MSYHRLAAACIVLCSLSLGCGGPPATKQFDPAVQGGAKLEAAKKIVEAVERGASEGDVLGAVEDYRNVPFDPLTAPDTAREIVDLLKKRAIPKAKGNAAVEIRGELGVMEGNLKGKG
jgi:hypothetical protein